MAEQLFELVTVARTPDGKCSACGFPFPENDLNSCNRGHSLGDVFRRPKYGYGAPLTRMVMAEANGSACLLCGGQVNETGVCDSGLRHKMGQMYPMNRKNTPSLFF